MRRLAVATLTATFIAAVFGFVSGMFGSGGLAGPITAIASILLAVGLTFGVAVLVTGWWSRH